MPDRSAVEQMEEERRRRRDEQRRKHDEERKRREAEMARLRDQERLRLRAEEEARRRRESVLSPPEPGDTTPALRERASDPPSPTPRRPQASEVPLISAIGDLVEPASVDAIPPPPRPDGPETAQAHPPRDHIGPTLPPPPPLPSTARAPQPAPAPLPPEARDFPDLSAEMRGFLALDPKEHFDLETLNALHLDELPEESRGRDRLLKLLTRRAEEFMERVKNETDSLPVAGSFIRERARDWFLHSGDEAGWAVRMPLRWGGLFAESRVPGGKLQPWVIHRLRALLEGCVRASGWTASLRKRLSRGDLVEKLVSRTPHQGWIAETAQALLDDLAARSRDDAVGLPLVRLSELAQKRTVRTVNEALADLFGGEAKGPWVILHPNRYPDCDQVAIRPPAHGASGATLSYDLFCIKVPASGAPVMAIPAASGVMGLPIAAMGAGGVTGAMAQAGSVLDAASVWESSAGGPEWKALLDSLSAQRAKLEPPPKDYRSNLAFRNLRTLIVEDAEARVAFIVTKWRGRPTGVYSLAKLLAEGRFAPTIATDYEYLEAELGELERRDPDYRPENLTWSFAGWSVAREGDFRQGLKYRAERAPSQP